MPSLTDELLDLLPKDGTPVSNRIMRLMLSRRLGAIVAQQDYFEARDRLFEKGLIGRQRGPGGQIFLSVPTSDREAPLAGAEHWSEQSLMTPLRTFLAEEFISSLDLPRDSATWLVDTSQHGQQGTWLNPDFMLATASRFRLVPHCVVDVHAFELKRMSSGSLQAVSQALAQTRFAHFGHLVWHLPAGSPFEARLGEIEDYCGHQGIGLILMREPTTPGTYEIRVDPQRKDTPAAAVESFLERRLTTSQQDELTRFIRRGLL